MWGRSEGREDSGRLPVHFCLAKEANGSDGGSFPVCIDTVILILYTVEIFEVLNGERSTYPDSDSRLVRRYLGCNNTPLNNINPRVQRIKKKNAAPSPTKFNRKGGNRKRCMDSNKCLHAQKAVVAPKVLDSYPEVLFINS